MSPRAPGIFLRLGRPDLTAYADRFDVPAADGGAGVTFLGVSSLRLDDGGTALLTDGFSSRPALLRTAFGAFAPDPTRIDAALGRLGLGNGDLAAVLPVHSHYDHVLDSAAVAQRTGAVLAGGTSTANVGRGAGLPEDRIRVVEPGADPRVRRLHPDLPGIGPLPARPLPRRHSRAGRAAGPDLAVPVR